MKIRTGLGVTAIVMTGALLAGCSGGGAAPASTSGEITGTVTGIWDATFKSSIDPIAKAFEKEHPGVKMDITYQGGDLSSVLSTQLQAGTAPDILITFPGGTPGAGGGTTVLTLASQGRLLDLSSSPWTKTIPDQWKSEVNYKDKTYAYPGIAQGMGAIYNQSTLDEYGLKIPTTLDEVFTLCADAKDQGVYAYAQGLGESTGGPQMMSYAQTATLVYGPDPDAAKETTDGTFDFAKSGWKDQLEIYKKMNDEGCFGEGALGRDRAQGGDDVAAGRALGIVDVSAVMSAIQAKAPDAKLAFAPMPATNDAKETVAAALLGYTLAINAKAKNPVAAQAFLEFLSEPKQIATHAAGFAALPAIPQEGYEAPAGLTEFAKYIDSGSFTKLPVWPNANTQDTINVAVQSLMLGNDTVDSTLAKIQAAYDKGAE
ncbi:ABC transporter substrate-binding protein [Plantibacter sp. 2H11-2]|uniref:ABC transporter substrate-binding protein n=1 Tax=Plantibacter sp. 2H11-2 TaxID=3414431 RepID=UPI003CF92520